MTRRDAGVSELFRPVTRRRVLRVSGAITAGLAVTTAASCSGGRKSQSGQASKSAGGTGTSGQPKRGRILTYPGGGGVGTYDIEGYGFDPASQLQFFAKAYTLFYERLLAYNVRTRAIEPELAQKW